MPNVDKARMDQMFPCGHSEEPRPPRSDYIIPDRGDVSALSELIGDFSLRLDRYFKANKWTIILNSVEPDESDRRLFDRLYDEWNSDTLMTSNMTAIITHPAYYKIIAMGKRALKFIFESMQAGTGPWFVALNAIVDKPPIRKEHESSARLMREVWLTWGRDHGYLDRKEATEIPPNL